MGRIGWIDRVRGVAIILMIVDHVLFFFPSCFWLRLSVTRFSLPLFMLCSGWLWAVRGVSGAGWVRVGIAGLLAFVPLVWSGLYWPDILVVYLAVLPFAGLVRRWPVVCLAVGLVQAFNLPVGWVAYEPGLVMSFIAAGVLCARGPDWLDEMEWIGTRLPSWFGVVGASPLQWYVGHLWIIAAVVTWWRL